ncbi:MAG TPA: hypothetical protein VEC37_06960, partial [Bacillota bacterium]|nr:hypothetical protein [Bacillota bacterium]
NGTPDLRGFGTASATNVPSTGAEALNGSLNGVITNVGDKHGKNFVELGKANMPLYNLTVTDPGHTHTIATSHDHEGAGKASVGSQDTEGTLSTTSSPTNISVSSGGSNTPHENRQPTYYTYKIMRLN